MGRSSILTNGGLELMRESVEMFMFKKNPTDGNGGVRVLWSGGG